jgi:hypothetical protein
MPWTGVTVCPVGNGMAAPLVTVLTERGIAGQHAGEQSQGDKCRRATDSFRRLGRCIRALL